jgi:NAD(P)-dependent dehydrogenase (short-subunit alcohol dehydrogenase family)
LVTGATSGIGLEAARRFAELGWEVFATTRDPTRAAALEAALASAGERGHVVTLDVDRPPSIAACAAEVFDRTGGYGVDVVVNNAGFARMSPVVDLTDADLREHFDTNVFGLVGVARAFLPKMIARRRGRIVNVSSSGGRMSLPLVGAYHAAKFAVEALSDAMRWELRPFGVGVSVIEPGPVRTKFAGDLVASTRRLPPGSPYAPVLTEVARIQALAERYMLEPDVIVRDIVHAASAKRPRARYVQPRLLALVIALAAFAPACLVDRVIAKMFGLGKLGPAASAP